MEFIQWSLDGVVYSLPLSLLTGSIRFEKKKDNLGNVIPELSFEWPAGLKNIFRGAEATRLHTAITLYSVSALEEPGVAPQILPR